MPISRNKSRLPACRSTLYACLLLAVIAGCRKEAPQQEKTHVIRVAANPQDRLLKPLTDALKKTLSERFPAEVTSVNQRSLTNNAGQIQQGEIELAVIPANIAYLAYTQGWDDLREPHRRLRGVAVLDTIPLHLIARDDSGIKRLREIRGKRIGIGGGRDSTTAVTAEMILSSLQLSPEDVHVTWMPAAVAVEQLGTGKLDAVFNRGNTQEFTVEEAMRKLVGVKGARLVPILRSETEEIGSTHPFLRPISIPAGMYGDHIEMETIGVDSLMVCSDTLPEELVYWITRTLVELRSGIASATHVDPDRVHATPIPLHPGAARYYRERELFH